MRTTLTLDPDVARALEEALRRTGEQRKTLINSALRRGLRELEGALATAAAPYATEPYDPGAPAVRDVHSVYDLLAFAEGEDLWARSVLGRR